MDAFNFAQGFVRVEPIIELLFELVRRQSFPERPSRCQSLFGVKTIEETQQFKQKFGQPYQKILKVECTKYFEADMQLVNLGASGQLKAVLIRPDIDEKHIPLIFESEIEKKHQAKCLVYYHEEEYLRILRAWQANAQEQLIAQAVVIKNKLIVKDCSLKTWNISFENTPILAKIPIEERENFELDEDGSFLYWPSPDIHLDLEALRITVDPQLQEIRKKEKQEYNEILGYAITKVRKSHHLRQKDITGLPETQVRRIEKGHHPSLSQLRTLAAVHQLTLNDYLEEVAIIVDHLYTSFSIPK